VKIVQIIKRDKTTSTQIIRIKFPVRVVTFQYGTEFSDVFKIKRIMSCIIIQWEKHKINEPTRQCYNCQSFGRSSNFCGQLSRCVKCNQLSTTQECKKPTDNPANYVNCGRNHTDNFTKCHSHTQLTFLHQHQSSISKPTAHAFQFKQGYFPALKPTASAQRSRKSRVQTASHPPDSTDSQSLITLTGTLKTCLSMFNIQNLCQTLRSLAFHLQNISDLLSKIMLVLETIVACSSNSI